MADARDTNATQDPIYTNRIENKYVVKQADLDDILDILDDNLKLSFPSKSTRYTGIASTYLDTKEMKFLRQQIDDARNKYKMRVRVYSPNGVQSNDKFLEVKYKIDGTRKKTRIQIDVFGLLQVVGGLPLPEQMKKLNDDVTQSDFDNAKTLIDSLSSDGPQPTIKVSYTRISYRGEDIRCTVDRDLTVEAYANIKAYDNSDNDKSEVSKVGSKFDKNTDAILEVKYPDTKDTPAWLKKMVSKYQQDEGFSKYLWGLDQVLK